MSVDARVESILKAAADALEADRLQVFAWSKKASGGDRRGLYVHTPDGPVCVEVKAGGPPPGITVVPLASDATKKEAADA